MSKGSRNRTKDHKSFEDNWERIFNKGKKDVYRRTEKKTTRKKT